jgi:hypothetical protein
MRLDDSLADVWFDRQSHGGSRFREDTASSPPLLPARGPDAARSGFVGALAGAAGGALAIATVDGYGHHARLAAHVRILLGQAPAMGSMTGSLAREWALAAALGGAVVGGLLGVLMRRLRGVVPRVAFAAVLSAALCTLLYAFVLPRVAAALAQGLPFGPGAAAALAFGACVGLAPPIRRPLRFQADEDAVDEDIARALLALQSRRTRGRPFGEDQSFPLVRRR